MELESLVVPEANAAEEAGKLIKNLPKLWMEANLEEQRKLLITMLDAVYVDAKKTQSIIAIKPKPPFMPIFQVAATKSGSDIRIINEPLRTQSGSPLVFLVETGEDWSRLETRYIGILCQTSRLVFPNTFLGRRSLKYLSKLIYLKRSYYQSNSYSH